MKRLWIAVAILLAMLGGTLANAWYLEKLSRGYEDRLNSAQELAAQGAWSNAVLLTRQVYQDWQDHTFYFHVLMRHTDIDDISLTFREVQEYLKLEEPDQYNAANARLVAQLGLLSEAEQLNLKNVL